jgi:glycosyltransferase involved in cell wall biosynthesis
MPHPMRAMSLHPSPDRAVLLVGNFLSGSSRNRGVCEDLAVRLAASGWSVMTTSDRRARLARLADMVGTAWRRRREYAVSQVDVYSGPGFSWAEAACWTLRRARKPYALTLHGGNLPAFARRWPGRVGRLLGSAPVVTTPSRYLLERMRPYRDDLRLLPNALDLADYRFGHRERARPRLVWLRAFHETYNPRLAARVLGRLAAEFPEIRMTMIGPDKGDGSLRGTRRVAEELGVADRLSLPGAVTKAGVPAALHAGDIFLNTTRIDNAPVSVVEAMACGLCVVSTDVGGIPYLLDHEEDALLVPPDDPRAMADAVRRLLTEPGLAGRLSSNARAKAEGFDWSRILPRWDALLHGLMQGGGPSPG